ncbi:MAG TPA: PIF1 family DEAD/DEAH box helicase [Candidatus Paceibacterota bacterium]|nr:PIF1 family DEAD/DEAH box helicase [Candidatus Paceibacterota bacterium]
MTQAEALTILKTGANVFLTGEPGSGKTHTVNQYVSWLRAHSIEPAITASTGIAATHIGGYTIHSWSGIGIKRSLSAYELDRIAQNEKVVKRIRATNILIIDEISMLSASTFSMVEAVCREVRGNDKPFGGIQVLLVGDFFQLPPVTPREDQATEADLFGGSRGSEMEPVAEPKTEVRGSVSDPSRAPQFAFTSTAWKQLNPIVCYISEQHRQEDDDFLNILSAIRSGDIEEEHRDLLRTRYAKKAEPGKTQLFSHNADVNQINDAELGKISESARVFNMQSRGSAAMVEGLKRGCLSPEQLVLKVGARVMFTKNDIAGRSYVNGTLGVVTGFAKESGYPVVKTNSGRSMVVEPTEWRIDDAGRTLAQITQLPLRLAWAMTVHKSQGMSLDAAHMDLSGAFEYGQGYVALSRVRTLKGLSLAGLNERALQVHPEIREKDAQLRKQSDVAREAFAKIPQEDLSQMQNNFIKACGGSVDSIDRANSEPELSKLDVLRKKHPNAYRPWSKEEDENLKERFLSGEDQKHLAQEFGRQPGSIKMRLIKLGLIDEE